jgi:hypothetical protein
MSFDGSVGVLDGAIVLSKYYSHDHDEPVTAKSVDSFTDSLLSSPDIFCGLESVHQTQRLRHTSFLGYAPDSAQSIVSLLLVAQLNKAGVLV